MKFKMLLEELIIICAETNTDKNIFIEALDLKYSFSMKNHYIGEIKKH